MPFMGMSSPGAFPASAARRIVATYGNGDFGRLGHGLTCISQVIPRVISALASYDVKAVDCGGAHTAVVTGG